MDERMEAIMRKLTAMALSMMFILGSIIPVGAEETQTRQSTISVSIDPVYTVTIPANTTIERGEQSVKLGSVSLDNARLEPDKNVNVSVSASGRQLHIRLWMVTKNSVQLHMQRVETVLI